MSDKIMIIEDDEKLATLVADFLQDQGYVIELVHEGYSAISTFEKFQPDIVLIDLMLPGKDGLSLCKIIREKSDVGIIIITAKGEESDKVLGLRVGADDYLSKPFGMWEMLARIEALSRRCANNKNSTIDTSRTLGPFQLQLQQRALLKDSRPIDLTRSEFDILELLTRNPGRVYSREELMVQIKGGNADSFDRAVDTHISNLRNKIELDVKSPQYLLTIWGVGYQFQP
ncbi:MAG: response regulator transcription factor [Gammaproteobacteria bacterium]|nr:response regulator transcription factor [Gammaproteobacteria bacterium]